MLFLSIALGLGRVILPAGEFTGIDLEDGGLPMIFTVVAAAQCATVILAMGLFRWAGLRLQGTSVAGTRRVPS